MRSSWITQMAPIQQMVSSSQRRREKPPEHGGSDCGDVSMSQGTTRVCSNHRKQGERPDLDPTSEPQKEPAGPTPGSRTSKQGENTSLWC